MIKKASRIFVFLTLIVWIGGYGAFLSNVHAIKPQDMVTKTDAIVVLTGGNFRISTGLSLFANGLAPELFITGVHNMVTQNEIIALWKGTPPLPECCITLGHQATTTYGNALEAKEWIEEHDIKSIRLVTSAYHMKRAMLEFQDMLKGTDIIVHPVEQTDYTEKDVLFWKITFDEYNKVIYRTVYLAIKNQDFLK
tara:strand:+ start:11429 stop:12013 length:585 start_codon:yes stop_codon:yes gene_type:complete